MIRLNLQFGTVRLNLLSKIVRQDLWPVTTLLAQMI